MDRDFVLLVYIDNTAFECDFVMKIFDIRQKARLQEMEAIGAAKAILSGSCCSRPATRTSVARITTTASSTSIRRFAEINVCTVLCARPEELSLDDLSDLSSAGTICGNRHLEQAKTFVAASGEKKAAAEGDLDATSEDLRADFSTLAGVHHGCMSKAADFEAETNSRDEELKAFADAKEIIAEATGAALSQVSFLQLSGQSSSVNFQAVRFVRGLGYGFHELGIRC